MKIGPRITPPPSGPSGGSPEAPGSLDPKGDALPEGVLEGRTVPHDGVRRRVSLASLGRLGKASSLLVGEDESSPAPAPVDTRAAKRRGPALIGCYSPETLRAVDTLVQSRLAALRADLAR
jgi:hypothetical protein